MHNVEFKAELRDLPLARGLLRRLGATFIMALSQTDTYFRIPDGRLKKRECAGEPTEWIFYDRANRLQPKLSHFVIYSENEARVRFGATPLPVWCVVRKVRELFMLGNVRIHLDQVEGLGAFAEFEALVSRSTNVAKCHERVQHLRGMLGPALGEAISCGYADLLTGEVLTNVRDD